MKKFNALFFAMALVAVVAFASLASAATFVGIDKDGNVEKVTVDPTAESGSRVTYESVSVPTSAKTADFLPAQYKGATNAAGIVGYKLFSYNGAVLAVSDDVTGAGDRVITFKVADDGTITYNTISKTGTEAIKGLSALGAGNRKNHTDYSGVRSVVEFNGYPVFVAEQGLSTLIADNWKFDDPDAFVSFDVSVDAAFTYNNKLYVLQSSDKSTAQKIYQVSTIERESTKDDVFSTVANLKGSPMVWSGVGHSGAFDVATANGYVYIANETGLYKFSMEEQTDTGIILNSSAPTVSQVNSGVYVAMTAVDDTLYALKADAELAKATKLELVSIKDDKLTTLYSKVSEDIEEVKQKAAIESFDICATSDVIAVTNLGTKTAFYAIDGEKWKLINENVDVYPTLALVKTASTTPDTPDTPATSTTVVDATKITDETQVANLTKASGASGTSAFVAQSDVTETTTGTTPSTDTQTAVKEKAGFDNSTVAAVKDYTLAKKGYVLVTTNPGYNAANVKVYFVKKASSSSASVAAAEESFTASLLDSSYAAISTGTSAYATSTSELEAGDYTLVTVTKTASGEGEGEGESGSTTSSSSGGCNAGFAAVSALLALAFVKKSR